VNINSVAIDAFFVDDILVWSRSQQPGQIGTPPPVIPPASYPTIPTSGGTLNPSQAQLNAAAINGVFRFNFNGTNNAGTGSVRTMTLPVGQIWRMECWGASSRISQNVAGDTQQGVAWGSFARGQIVIPTQNTFIFLVGQMGRRIWQGNLGQPTGTVPSIPAFGFGGRANLHTNVPAGNSSAQGAGMSAVFAVANNINNVIIAGGGAGGANNGTAATTSRGRTAVNQFPSANAPINGGNTAGVPANQIGGNPGANLIGQGAHTTNTGGRRTSGGAGYPGGLHGGNATNGEGGCAYVRTATAPTWSGIANIPHRMTNAEVSQRAGVDTAVNDFNGMIRLTRLA